MVRRSRDEGPGVAPGPPAILAWAAAAALALVFHLTALGNGFLNWDDGAYVVDNAALRGRWPEVLGWSFTAFHSNNWHPLTWISHALDLRLFGLEPLGHHLGNVVLHAANTFLVGVLVFLLARRARGRGDDGRPAASANTQAAASLSRAVVPGLVAALLFGLHPLHVESVAWVSERKDVLSAFFALLSVTLYLRHAERPGARFPTPSLVCFALALLSKPMAATLPLVLVLIDVYPLRRVPGREARKALLEKLPFLALSAGSALLTLLAQSQGGALGTLEAYPVSVRLTVALQAVAFYLEKMLLPVGLSPLYPYPRHGEASLGSWASLVSAALALGASVVALQLWRRGRPALGTAWLCYLVLLAPVLGLVHFGPQAAADRYTYTSLLPWFVLAGFAFDRLLQLANGRPAARAALIALPVAATGVLGLLTVEQGRVWRSSVALWTRVIALHPRSELAFNRRADAYVRLGQDDRALADLDRSIELAAYPFEPSLRQRGKLLLGQGRHEEALRDVSAALAVSAESAELHNVRGACHAAGGRLDLAVAEFTRAIELDLAGAEGYANRALARTRRGDAPAALADFDAALDRDPRNVLALHGRAALLAAQGETAGALRDLARLVELEPGRPDAYLGRCELLHAAGRHEAALQDCTHGLQLDPRGVKALRLRGLVLLRLRRLEEAKADLDRAVELAPGDVTIRVARGAVLGQMGKPEAAIRDFDRAVELDPSSGQAYYNRAVARRSAGDREGAAADFRAALETGDEAVRRRLLPSAVEPPGAPRKP